MVTGTYFTSVAPSLLEGFLLQSETRVRIGTAELFGSLETTSYVYSTYNASIGLTSSSFDIGTLDSISVEVTQEVEAVEAANVRNSGIDKVTDEETTISIGLKEFKKTIMELLIASSVMYTLGQEAVITWGEGCTLKPRPIAIEAVNRFCGVPSSPDMDLGISMMVVTIYSVISQAGLSLEFSGAEEQVVDTEWRARPVLSLATSNRYGNIYLV